MKKEEKDKIKQFNREISEMKKETYNTFYRQASQGENSPKPRKSLISGIIIRHFLFLIFFCMLSSGLWMLSGSLETSGIYIGNSIIDNRVVIIPFLLGILLLYFMKDAGVPFIIIISGAVFIIAALITGGNLSFIPLPGNEYKFITALTVTGGVMSAVIITGKFFSKK